MENNELFEITFPQKTLKEYQWIDDAAKREKMVHE